MYTTNPNFASFSESDSPDSITLQNDMRLPDSGLPNSSAVFTPAAAPQISAPTPAPRRRRCQCGGACGGACHHKKQGMGDWLSDLQAGDFASLPGDLVTAISSNVPMLLMLGVGGYLLYKYAFSRKGSSAARTEFTRGRALGEAYAIKRYGGATV